MGSSRPDDFYLRQNKEIYETIYSMFNYSLTIDPVTVLENTSTNCPFLPWPRTSCCKITFM